MNKQTAMIFDKSYLDKITQSVIIKMREPYFENIIMIEFQPNNPYYNNYYNVNVFKCDNICQTEFMSHDYICYLIDKHGLSVNNAKILENFRKSPFSLKIHS